MAERLHGSFVAAYVETPEHAYRSPQDRDRLTHNLRLAESLGAEVVTLTGDRVAEAVGAYATRSRITRIIIGKPTHARWHDLVFGSLVDEVIRASGDVDVYVINCASEAGVNSAGPLFFSSEPSSPADYGMGVFILLLTTLLAAGVDRHFGLTEVIMVYLLGIVLVALRYSRRVSLLISALAVVALDFLFVPPRYSFAVSDGRYIFTFIGMFVVGLIITNLAARVRSQAAMALLREQRTRALYELTRTLSQESDPSALIQRAAHHVVGFFNCQSLVLLPSGKAASSMSLGEGITSQNLEQAASTSDSFSLNDSERGVARWVFEHNTLAGLGSPTLPDHPLLHAPLSSAGRCIGVLSLRPTRSKQFADPEQRNLLIAFCDQIAMALERATWAKEAQRNA
jgi:two-component system sensor histidine kinase KdpD